MKIKRLTLWTVLFWCLSFTVQAQVERRGNPLSLQKDVPQIANGIVLPALTPDRILKNEARNGGKMKPYLFAFAYDTLLSIDKDGQWDRIADGSRIWRLKIESSGAYSLNLLFSKFNLPNGVEVFLYTPDYSVIRGAFTAFNNKKSGELATVPIPGESIIIEMDIPSTVQGQIDFEIERISHDYKNAFGLKSDFGRAGPCNVDINCPSGAEWQIEKRSVAKFIRSGIWLCSGALINNTLNDGRPFFLTANHCITTQLHAHQSLFFFRYESPSCGGTEGPLSYTISSSELIATYANLDFSLVELSVTPPESYDPYYAGWDRRLVTYFDTVTCIHHPSGDVKKISQSNRRVVSGDFGGGGYDKNAHWKITEWDLGTTEPGSSGSPLFNSDHLIIGDLTGGDASCSYNYNDYFQKFNLSWDKYPDSSQQLKCWLDPNNSGVEMLNGMDPYLLGQPIANFTSRPKKIQVGKKVYFTDVSSGGPDQWLWSFEGGTPSSSTKKDPGTVTFASSGLKTIQMIVMNNLGADTISQTIRVEDYPEYTLSETRVVRNRNIILQDQSSGDPYEISWSLTGNILSELSGSERNVYIENPGTASVEQVVRYGDHQDTIFHLNQIQVRPETLVMQSTHISHVGEDEHTDIYSIGQQGLLPGTNSVGISAFAEKFTREDSILRLISGISFEIGRIIPVDEDLFLTGIIWDKDGNVKTMDSINLKGLKEGNRVTLRFGSPAGFDSEIYAGFLVPENEQVEFAANMAVHRGSDGDCTAYGKVGGSWKKLYDIAGINTALNLTIEVSQIQPDFSQEFTVSPLPATNEFEIDLGQLVFESCELSVYDERGRMVVSEITSDQNRIHFKVYAPVSGIYIARFRIDQFYFSKKILIIRD